MEEKLKEIQAPIDKSLYTEQKIKYLISKIEELKNLLNGFIHSYHNKKVRKHQAFFLDILERYKHNSQAIVLLLEEFIKKETFKLSIGILTRTIITDTLTVYYLTFFYGDEDTLKNEVDVLTKDFVEFCLKISKKEYELNKKNNFSKPYLLDEAKYKKTVERIKEYFIHYYNSNGEIKSNEELRKSSKEELFGKNAVLSSKSEKIFEKTKYDVLLKTGQFEYGQLFLYFLHYSQFLHLSLGTKDMMLAIPDREVFNYFRIWQHVAVSCSLCIQIIDNPNNELIESVRKIQLEFDTIPQ